MNGFSHEVMGFSMFLYMFMKSKSSTFIFDKNTSRNKDLCFMILAKIETIFCSTQVLNERMFSHIISHCPMDKKKIY